MIPKKISFYWGNESISWMRFMTLKSFRILNPDWKMVLYLDYSKKNDYKVWKDVAIQDFFNFKGENFLDRVKDLNIEIVKFDSQAEKDFRFIKNKTTPPQISDFFRWKLLSTEPGFYSDMDILYVKPIEKYYNRVKNYNTIVCFRSDYFSIGFLGSSGRNIFFKDILKNSFDSFDIKKYQTAGVLNKYDWLKKKANIKNISDEKIDFWKILEKEYPFKNYNNPMELIYNWRFNQTEEIFLKTHKKVAKECIGIHWYGGNYISQKFNNLMNESNYRKYDNTFTYFVDKLSKKSVKVLIKNVMFKIFTIIKRKKPDLFFKEKDIGLVCCYFNPCSYVSKLNNYISFRKSILNSGIRLITVELAFGKNDFELINFSDVIKLRIGEENIMWQKECLLNIGIQKLINEGYKKIVWLDADIIFNNDNWAKNISLCLEKYPFCQGFENALIYDYSDNNFKNIPSIASIYCKTKEIPNKNATPGGVWAARAEVLNKTLLYDAGIIGGGDNLIFFAGFFSQKKYLDQLKETYFIKNLMTDDFANHYFKWAENFSRIINGQVGFAKNTIKFLNHGKDVDRQYRDRHSILLKHNFNPEKDIIKNEKLCWEWNSEKKGLHKDVKDYFVSRKEDQ